MISNKSFSTETSERYARALFELVNENSELEAVEKNIKELLYVYESHKDLEHFISQLDNNKSTYFSPMVLKSISKKLCPMLTVLFNKCHSEGYFPDELKVAKVIPLYKNKGSIKEISNYRLLQCCQYIENIL